jgi:hypothetical protein
MTEAAYSGDGGVQGATVTNTDTGSGTTWNAVLTGLGAGCVYDTAHKHRVYAIHYTTGSTAVACYSEWTTAVGAAATKWFRFYLWLAAVPGTDTPYLMIYSGGSYAGSVMITTNGKLCFQTGTYSQVAITTANVGVNGTYPVRIEGKIVGAGGTGGSVELKLFNTMDSATPTETTSATGLDTIGQPGRFRFGTPSGDKANFSAWLSGHAVSDVAYLGPEVTSTTYTKAGEAASAGAGEGASAVVVHTEIPKAGGAAVLPAGGGDKAAWRVKAGGAAAGGLAGGDKVFLGPSALTKDGGAAARLAAAGVSAGPRRKAGGAAAAPAGAGTAAGGARTYAKDGGAAAPGFGWAFGYSTGWVREVMRDSLVIGDIELLGGGVVSTNPACAGAVFRLANGYDPGAPQPTADVVASYLLDGERPYGRRASNRVIKLPIWVIGQSRDNLAAAREHLEATIDADMYIIRWARDRGEDVEPLPLIFDCFRANPTQVTYDIKKERNYYVQVEISVPALPYGRSDTQERLAFASPVPQGPPPPPAPVLIDDYETISDPRCYQTTRCVVGPHSCCWDPDDDRCGDRQGLTTRFDYTAVLPAVLDLTGMSSVSMHLGFGSRWYHCLPYHGRHGDVNVELTLFDTESNLLSFSRSHLRLPVTADYQSPCFTKVSMRLPADPVFHIASVAGYNIKVSNHHWNDEHHLRHVTLYLDELKAYPDSVTVAPVARGAVYTLYGLKGTTRAALSAQFQQPPSAGTPTVLNTPGVGTYTVPAGTNWLKVECLGGGGAGAGRTTAGLGGGGGGAEYVREEVFPATDGQLIPYSVGTGGSQGASPADGADTFFGPGPSGPMTLQAHGGKSAAQNSATGGQGGTGSAGSVHRDGGAGRNATGSVGGGGGSSGGRDAPGTTPAGTGAAVFTSGSGNWTCPAGVTSVLVECWGGGGSGASGDSSHNGGGGGGAEYSARTLAVTPGNLYPYFVGGGGAATGGGGQNGNPGQDTYFGVAGANRVTGHAGLAGTAYNGWGGQGLGGSGTTTGTHYNGGTGGQACPYSGGGGSSAGPSGPGNSGDGYGSPGSAPSDGGKGGTGSGATANAGGAGAQPGGGGGGTWSSVTSGAGGAGKIRLTFPGQQGGGAPDQYGAPAVTGGGAGGAGGATSGSAGSAGSQPGGGGGGANSGGPAQAGGAGGAGRITITPYASQAWKSLIVHRPPRGTPKTYQPLVSVGAGADVPDGSHWYAPPPVTGVNALFNGTYSVYLIAASWNGSGSRTVTVTVRQTEYAGGPAYTAATVPVAFTPSQVTNGVLCAGVLTLPVRDIPPDNSSAGFAVAVTDTNTADRFYDALFIDTMGQLVLINAPSGGYLRHWIDAPDANAALGRVLGSQTDRRAAVNALVNTGDVWSGGPLTVEPGDGDNILFAYCPDGLAPAVGATYYPAYYFDRTE